MSTTVEGASRPVAFAFDYVDGAVFRWSRTADGVECERDESYTPSFYITTESDNLDEVRGHLSVWPGVESTAVEEWRRGFRHDPERVLRVDVSHQKPISLSRVPNVFMTAFATNRYAFERFTLYCQAGVFELLCE